MKLFQQLLVAGTAASLIAPIGAIASDYNIEGMNSYVRKKSSPKKQKQFNSKSFNNDLATFEKNVDSPVKTFDAGSFSTTTAMDGKVIMALGAISGFNELTAASKNPTSFNYVVQLNLNTSLSLIHISEPTRPY